MTAYQPFPRRTDSTEQTLFVFVLVLSIGYVIVCGLCVYELNASPDPLSGDAWLLLTVAPLTIFPLLILFFSWIRVLSRAFFRAGRPGAVRRLRAFVAWRIGVLASVVLTVILNSPRPTDVESFRHDQSLWFVMRIAIGGMYIWCALSMHRAAAMLPSAAPGTTQPGYIHPAPAGPALPPPYYPPGHPLSTTARPPAPGPAAPGLPPAGAAPSPWAPPAQEAWAPPAQSAWPPPTQDAWASSPGGPPAPPPNPWVAPAANPTSEDGRAWRDPR